MAPAGWHSGNTMASHAEDLGSNPVTVTKLRIVATLAGGTVYTLVGLTPNSQFNASERSGLVLQ